MSELERNTLDYLIWRYGLFLKFSQLDQRFNNIAMSTFLHSTAIDQPSSYSDDYLIFVTKAVLVPTIIVFLYPLWTLYKYV